MKNEIEVQKNKSASIFYFLEKNQKPKKIKVLVINFPKNSQL